MELLIAFLTIVIVLVALDLAALRWGADSRRPTSEWLPRTDADQNSEYLF